ncbi:Ku protein [Streptomyces sp. V3I7]|uniref:non-homologous end joining protein Ku n=1 Tax=Streptomyces sp. V3I7 TaxID=3042278 RepID=UPI00278A4C42|nr:Ku protein [Streptomyces sp. V3I7]MDQ0994346.1 DNA end-binding protein Ku [Streptomyces sp. V3I7]
MARAVWNGALTFGLVSVPVQLFTATDSHTIRFHQLQRGTSDRVRNRRVNERTGEEVAPDDIVKGFDAGDEYVIVEPGELDGIAPGRSREVEVTGFVDLADVEPVFFDRTYYLGPKDEQYEKVYAVLEKALERAGKAGIATFVMRNRQYLVAVKAENGILTLHTLHWADEIRDPHKEVDHLPEGAEPGGRELKMAEQLIDSLSMDWDPDDFHDTYHEKVEELIEAKKKGETVEKAEQPAQATNVVDLMDALRASVDRAKSKQGARSKKAAPPRKARARSAPAPDLGSLTKAELYELAAEADVHGRSSMNREELLEALAHAGAGGHARAS